MQSCSVAIDSDGDSGDDDYVEVPANADAAAAAEADSVYGQAPLAVYRCLFCADASASSADELIGCHLVQAHSVRLADFLATSGLREQADWVALVAFLRRRRRCQPPGTDGTAAEAQLDLQQFLAEWRDVRSNDGDSCGLVSGIDDPLMYEVDIEELLLMAEAANPPSSAAAGAEAAKDRRIAELEGQLAALKHQVAGMSALLRRLAGGGSSGAPGDALADDNANAAATAPRTVAELTEEDDGYYVDSYSGASIHAEMLQDTVRTGAYYDFVVNNPALFADRLVLDVGCGSGILSMFAARAGARRVLAVDCAGVIEEAAAAAADNGLADRIDFHRGKLEQLSRLRGVNADAVISEWMGYFLLYEGMMESVLFARDNCLRQGGAVYPRVCSLRLCGIDSAELYARHVLHFDDVFGVRLAYLKERGLAEPHVVFDLQADWVATDSPSLATFDLLTAAPADARFRASVSLTARRDCTLHALAGYFDVDFLGSEHVNNSGNCRNVAFSTGPLVPATHWGQTLFCLRSPVRLALGQAVTFSVAVGQPDGHPRGVCVSIEQLDGSNSQCYVMK